MLFRHPDNPVTISLDRLKSLDAEKPDSYIASPKLDGWRHVAMNTPDGWRHYSKHGKPSAIDPELRAEFEALPWPAGIGLDAELLGPRHKGTTQTLFVFDVLFANGEWVEEPYRARLDWLNHIFTCFIRKGLCKGRVAVNLTIDNPNMVEFFSAQLTSPFSEGLVIRSATQRNMGSYAACADNNFIMKVKFKEGNA